ncbi:Reticulon-like protein B5 [Acorus gramineus]|uniref:Reticulon-like protein n=1 Tax=Acorus gramineus TaxID=55184 RepID=A0AAV9B5Y3_ACOGR|nr:Reticulon-like protein B5 [Acorus gramineus]
MVEEVRTESPMEKVNETIHSYRDSSSSSDSDDEKPLNVSVRKNRLFGRQKPLHSVLGGGKSADVVLWRNKPISGGILAGVTVVWLLFEWLGYTLLTLVCHSLILALAVLFLWSNASSFANKSPPKFPEVNLSEEVFIIVAQSVRYEINEAFATFHDVASGKDLKKFLMVVAGLWVLSVVGSWFNFLTLFYIEFVTLHVGDDDVLSCCAVFVILYTVPVLYEKHEDQVDTLAEKAKVEMNKQYTAFDEKVLRKLPRCFSFKDEMRH